MTRFLSPILALSWMAAVLVPAPAGAGGTGLYATVSGLYVMPSDHEAIPVALPVGQAWHDLGMEQGAGGLVAVGYGFADRWRGEVELGYRIVDVDRIDGWAGPFDHAPLAVAGGFRTLSVMTNLYYRFLGEGVTPYLGAGIGVVRHDLEAKSRTLTIGDKRGHFTFDGGETVLAWQGMAGLAQPLSETVEFRLGYRFFQTGDGEFGADELGYRTHNVELGLTFTF